VRSMSLLASNKSGQSNGSLRLRETSMPVRRDLHRSWQAFIEYCLEMQHGEIERLKIQDGLPVLAELTKKKVKFAP
jgi:hypothetical protein